MSPGDRGPGAEGLTYIHLRAFSGLRRALSYLSITFNGLSLLYTFRLRRWLWRTRAHVLSSPTTLEPTRQPHRARASSGYPQSVYLPFLLKFLNRLLATTRTLKSSMEGSTACILARSSDSKTDLLNSLSANPNPVSHFE